MNTVAIATRHRHSDTFQKLYSVWRAEEGTRNLKNNNKMNEINNRKEEENETVVYAQVGLCVLFTFPGIFVCIQI